MMDLFLSISLYFLLFLVLNSMTKHLLRKLRNLPPAPLFTLPVIGHIHLLKKPLHKQLHRLSKKYGPVFSLQLGSRRLLVVTSSSAAEDCLSKNDVIFANRPRLLAGKHLGYNYTSMSWASYGDHWRNLRRISSIELLSYHRIQSLSRIGLDEVREMVRSLFHACGNSGNVVEVRTVIFELLFNVMTRMILGERYYGENAVMSGEGKEFQDITHQLNEVANVSAIADFIPLLQGFGDAEEKFKAIHERRDKFFQDLVERIRHRVKNTSSSDVGKTILEVLLSLQESDPESYSDEIIRSIIVVLLQAGSDTSVTSLEWAMALLLNNPAVLGKVQAEIDTHVGHDRLIDDSDLARLPYLNCIVKETLRLYPVVPLLLPHESSEETIVGGFRVPPGTMLFINVQAIHRDPVNWEDPLIFNPERFMTKEGERAEFRYMPFGKGRRGCPGEALAMRVICLALGSIVQCFHWQRVNVELENMDEGTGFIVTKSQPLVAKCSTRSCMVNLFSRSLQR